MKTVSVRLNEEETRVFEAYADLMGIPLSTLFKIAMEEKLQDELDIKIIQEYEKRKLEGKLETLSLEEVIEELDLWKNIKLFLIKRL